MKNGKDIVPWKCSEWGVEFETQGGGICKECGQILCRKHLNKHSKDHAETDHVVEIDE
jgi:hypothetical protein